MRARKTYVGVSALVITMSSSTIRHLARSVPELAHLLLVSHQLAVEFLDVDLDRGYPRIRLVSSSRGMSAGHGGIGERPTELMASWRVGFGFLAEEVPNIRFMAEDALVDPRSTGYVECHTGATWIFVTRFLMVTIAASIYINYQTCFMTRIPLQPPRH